MMSIWLHRDVENTEADGDRRLRRGRFWLVLLYGVATLLGQGLHDHGPDSHPPPTVANIACEEAALHVEAHPAQNAGHPFDACPACQFRAQNLSCLDRVTAHAPVAVERAADFPPFKSHVSPVLRPTGRAPPIA